MYIYNLFYNIFETYIFGAITIGSYQELVAILFSTFCSLMVVALPFVIIYQLLLFVGRLFQ